MTAGSFAGPLFANLGADVVKIERPDGNGGMRQWPPLTGETDSVPGFNENFAPVNRGKRSEALNLKRADDVAQFKQLAAVADIFIENY